MKRLVAATLAGSMMTGCTLYDTQNRTLAGQWCEPGNQPCIDQSARWMNEQDLVDDVYIAAIVVNTVIGFVSGYYLSASQ